MKKPILLIGFYALLLLLNFSCDDATEADLFFEAPQGPAASQSLGLQAPTEYIYFQVDLSAIDRFTLGGR